MFHLKLFFVFVLLICVPIKSSVTINRFEECVLNPKLVEEIASYKNVTQKIMRDIINDYGAEMYTE